MILGDIKQYLGILDDIGDIRQYLGILDDIGGYLTILRDIR